MTEKRLPFTKEMLEEIAAETPTPFHLYDEAGITDSANSFLKAFDWAPGGFKNFFAVKALPNPAVLRLLKTLGMGVDCSSYTELEIARRCGFEGREIMFSSNDTPDEEFLFAKELGTIINLDDISHIDTVARLGCIEETMCLRFNPGDEKGGNDIIGIPTEAKYGHTRKQIIEGYTRLKKLGVQRFGLHTMVASNELENDYFIETARIMFLLAADIYKETGIEISFINLGGGMGIPYTPQQKAIDIRYVSKGIKKEYYALLPEALPKPRLFAECARIITGPHGYLVSRVLHIKQTYKTFIGLDSSMANLMRPAIYGAYHHITVPGKETAHLATTADVTGSLCENNDKFAIDRRLPQIDRGDLLVIHDTGAHGHAMGFNYNGKLRSAEILLTADGQHRLIRRKETLEDYLATAVW
ncbi:MAG: diaminopimelate decarboxylase [Spirochaetales bacterium]|nr:diaminopimelate decarboxylase [Spirochaetales bacterium]